MKSAEEIARAFLKLSQPEVGDYITNLKLQKLLYYAQGFSIVILGKKLFAENILAWEHGPVVREVYDIYKNYSAEALPVSNDAVILTNEQSKLIQDVWNVYGQFSAWRLREMTHSEAPWQNTQRDEVISDIELTSYFKTVVE